MTILDRDLRCIGVAAPAALVSTAFERNSDGDVDDEDNG